MCSVMRVNIVTNGRIAWLINTWVLDWTPDLLYTRRLKHLWLQFTVALSPNHTITVYSLSLLHTRSVCSSLNTHWILLVCCPSSLRVPASYGRRSPSCVPELSPSHSHGPRSLPTFTIAQCGPGSRYICFATERLSLRCCLQRFHSITHCFDGANN
jgi:hypothetical protein